MSKCVGNIGSTVLTHMRILAVCARTEAYTWHQGSQTGLLLLVLVHRSILGVSAPIQSYNWYHWYQQGDGPSARTGKGRGAPFPNPAEGLWRAPPFETVTGSFQPRLKPRLTE